MTPAVAAWVSILNKPIRGGLRVRLLGPAFTANACTTSLAPDFLGMGLIDTHAAAAISGGTYHKG